MTTRNRHQQVDDRYPVLACFVCGTQGAKDNTFTYYREGSVGNTLCLCEKCQEDCKSELCDEEIFGDCDTLPTEAFDRILDWGRYAAIMSFTERENAVRTIDDVKAFFDALSAYIAWHPDNSFKDYVRGNDPYKTALAHEKDEKGCVEGCAACEDNRVHTALFTPEDAIALDAVMHDCAVIIDKEKTGKDIYHYGIEAVQRAGLAPKDDAPPLLTALRLALAHYNENDIEECVSSLELAKRLEMSDDIKRTVNQAHEEASSGSVEKALHLIEDAIHQAETRGENVTPAKQPPTRLSDNVKVLILAEKESVLVFETREGLEKAMQFANDEQNNDDRITTWLRHVAKVPFVEVQGLVLFEMR